MLFKPVLNYSYKTHVLGRVRSTVFEPALRITQELIRR